MNGLVLPSWNDGHARSEILAFFFCFTSDESGDFVSPADRVAVFDNDGTLWCEQPMQVQAFFLFDRLKHLATQARTDPFEFTHDAAGEVGDADLHRARCG